MPAAKKTLKNSKTAATKTAKKKPATQRANNRPGKRNDLDPQRVEELLSRLRKTYPDVECALLHRNPWELLVATILSAQCTDARVNMVTPALFEAFPTPKAMAAATPAAIEEYVKSTGFYRNKAKSIHGAAKRVVEVYGGKLPQTMDELLTLPGAARKTANVVLGVAFHKAEGVVVDTHVLRISQRLGLTQSTDPKKVEQDLMRILPHDRWIQFSHEIIHHGRQICVARKPKCELCPLEDLCHAKDKTWSSV
jgi:endonuclease-3